MAKRRAFLLSASQYMQQVRLPPEFMAKSRALTDNLLTDVVHRYHVHQHEDGGRVNGKQWKLVKDKQHIACFRSVSPDSRSSDPTASVPEVLAVGTIMGCGLEDLFHGAVNLTPEAMHVESALAQSDLIDSRVLAFLSPPTSTEPFDTVTVKWVLRNHASMSKQRDYVYLEASGTTMSLDGEPLGYLLAHSVSLAAVPEFHKDSHISRGHVSYCYLFRQRKDLGVELFFRGAINPLGGVKDRVTIGLSVDMVLNTCSTSIQLAMMKKLMFCLRTLPVPEPDVSSDSSRSSRADSSNGSNANPGERRSRSVGSSGSFLRRLTSFRSRSGSSGGSAESDTRRTSIFGRRLHSQSVDSVSLHGSACDKCGRHFHALKTKAKCSLCSKLVCSRCRVVKRVIAFDEQLMYPEKLDFCVECVANTSNVSAAWIAAQELHELEQSLDETENPLTRHSTMGNPESSDRIRKPVWELKPSVDNRHTMSSDFSTRSSTSSRYLVTLTSGAGLDEVRHTATTSTNSVSDMDKGGFTSVDAGLSASGLSHKYGGFVLDDSEDEGAEDDDGELHIMDSFVDDNFIFDETDEIFLSGSEHDKT